VNVYWKLNNVAHVLCWTEWDWDFITSLVWECGEPGEEDYWLLAYATWQTSGRVDIKANTPGAYCENGSLYNGNSPSLGSASYTATTGPANSIDFELTLDYCRLLDPDVQEPPSYIDLDETTSVYTRYPTQACP